MSSINNQKVSENIPKLPETLGKVTEKVSELPKKVSEVSEKVSEVSERIISGGSEKIITKGKVSELQKVVSEKVSEPAKVVSEIKKLVSEPKAKTKRNLSEKQLANLRKGNPKNKVSEPETPILVPKVTFNFPTKALVIMAFIAGGTLGFVGIWNWYKNQKKAKELPQEVDLSNYLPEGTEISQEELDAIRQFEESKA